MKDLDENHCLHAGRSSTFGHAACEKTIRNSKRAYASRQPCALVQASAHATGGAAKGGSA